MNHFICIRSTKFLSSTVNKLHSNSFIKQFEESDFAFYTNRAFKLTSSFQKPCELQGNQICIDAETLSKVSRRFMLKFLFIR